MPRGCFDHTRPEYRARMSAACRGPKSAEHRATLSAAQQLRRHPERPSRLRAERLRHALSGWAA